MRSSKLEELAYKIADLLSEYHCHIDVAIYFENKRLFTFTDTDENYGKWVLQEGYKGSNYTEYVNDNTITITFEGDFYDVMNYGYLPELYDKFQKLLESCGFYFELGITWNLALYEI